MPIEGLADARPRDPARGATPPRHLQRPLDLSLSISLPTLALESFGTTIVSTQPVIVERAFYTDAGGVMWAAGTNATATRLP
jgi:hypothetical protein